MYLKYVDHSTLSIKIKRVFKNLYIYAQIAIEERKIMFYFSDNQKMFIKC